MPPALSSTWYPFDAHPDSDSCWSLSAGPDGRIYAAACCEHLPGGVVKLLRFDPDRQALDCLFDLDEQVDDPRDSGRATQCKIHYSFAPSPADGVLYMATHLSGPPIDQPAYSPWNSWHDPERCFRGSALVAFDTRRDRVLWWETLLPKEGCRCLLHDPGRGLLYALSYPRDHLVAYDLKRREARTLGRIGSVNSQVLFLDGRHRVWTTDDFGHVVRYDPATDRIERSPEPVPHDARHQTGWHSVLYDAVAAPDGEAVYAVTWNGSPRLLRFRPEEEPFGRVEDLGAVTPEHDPTLPEDYFVDHCGGLTFARDGMLYYVASEWDGGFPTNREATRRDYADDEPRRARGVIWRLDPASLQRQAVGELNRPGSCAQYVSRGAVDERGDLYFGHVGPHPVGLFRVAMPADRRSGPNPPLRLWG